MVKVSISEFRIRWWSEVTSRLPMNNLGVGSEWFKVAGKYRKIEKREVV